MSLQCVAGYLIKRKLFITSCTSGACYSKTYINLTFGSKISFLLHLNVIKVVSSKCLFHLLHYKRHVSFQIACQTSFIFVNFLAFVRHWHLTTDWNRTSYDRNLYFYNNNYGCMDGTADRTILITKQKITHSTRIDRLLHLID